MLEPLGIGGASRRLHMELPAAARDKASELLRLRKIDNPFIIFHPGSARKEKFWKPDRWSEVIDRARTQWGANAVITGGNWGFEQEHIREIKAKLRRPVIDLSGQTDLLTLTALIAQARLLVTVDSAVMHLAATQQTPQVALFG